jgi:hypothetical protein
LACCVDFGFNHKASSAAHPQMNGQVKHANEIILQGMKTRMFLDLEARGRNWHKELSSVLWVLHTNVNHATRDTLLHLVYRADAMLQPEIFIVNSSDTIQ